jgi:hypothetical protein
VTTPRPAGSASPEEDQVPKLSSGRYDSFVVRVLRRNASGGFVHGQVIHIGTRRSKRFTDLETAMTFIQAHLDDTATDASGASS